MKLVAKKILQHPDKDEIIAYLISKVPELEIAEKINSKYKSDDNKKYKITASNLSLFKKEYLDVYKMIEKDIKLAKKEKEDSIPADYNVKSSAYKAKMLELADKEINIRDMIKNLCMAIEGRIEVIYEEISNSNTNSKTDTVLIGYANTLTNILDKYYKYTEGSGEGNIINNNNITIQVLDKHVAVFYETIKEVLANMDFETSLLFMEVFNKKMSKIKEPQEIQTINTDRKYLEVSAFAEEISDKLNNG